MYRDGLNRHEAVAPEKGRNMFYKAWERCRSFCIGRSRNKCCQDTRVVSSWHGTTSSPKSRFPEGEEEDDVDQHNKRSSKTKQRRRVAPVGCFSVYVGPEKRRFVVKTEFANHPLFRMLLEDAELEYGFNSQGPILLPCGVDLFYKVLAEMDSGDRDEIASPTPSCSSMILSPHRSYCAIKNGCGAYKHLSPSRMLKLNQR